jgi:mono/diheme cytochrome c family protein
MRVLAACAALALAATACGDTGADTTTPAETAATFLDLGGPVELPPLPELDADAISVGRELYVEHCASCHGEELEGDPDWMIPNTDGSYPPPPQDSTGHTWHHGDGLLVDIIINGSEFPQSRMPAYAGILDEDQVMSILEYFKSTWGPAERDVQWSVTVRETEQG